MHSNSSDAPNTEVINKLQVYNLLKTLKKIYVQYQVLYRDLDFFGGWTLVLAQHMVRGTTRYCPKGGSLRGIEEGIRNKWYKVSGKNASVATNR
jgi:hypothetical protein